MQTTLRRWRNPSTRRGGTTLGLGNKPCTTEPWCDCHDPTWLVRVKVATVVAAAAVAAVAAVAAAVVVVAAAAAALVVTEAMATDLAGSAVWAAVVAVLADRVGVAASMAQEDVRAVPSVAENKAEQREVVDVCRQYTICSRASCRPYARPRAPRWHTTSDTAWARTAQVCLLCERVSVYSERARARALLSRDDGMVRRRERNRGLFCA